MLLQLPLELQQRIAGNLSVHQALNLREVSHQCRRLASASIRSVTLSSAADVRRVSDSFPGLTHLSLKPETHEDMVLLSSAFHPEQDFAFPPTLTDLEIDTSCAGFDPIRWFELGKLAACSVLDSIQISACYVDLTADDNVLQKLTGLITAEARLRLQPTYPPMCFLSSGIVNADNLSRCTNLQRLKTYTRSNEDTDDLMASLAGHRSLQVLELHVPCVGSVVAAATDLSRVTDLKLIGNLAADEFPFDLSAFPNVEFLVVSLHYISPEPVGPRIEMRHLTTVWLNNVTNIYALQHAPALSTLSLNYSQSVFTSMEPHLRGVLSTIPELRRLEIRNVDVDAGSIVACPRLQEVVLADVIGKLRGTQSCRSARTELQIDGFVL